LQADASGGTGSYSFDWTTSDGQVPPAGATSSVTFGAAGDYTINLTVNDGETSVTASHTVTAASALSADFTATADISNQ
jgi:PKD repeat protein